MCKALVLFVLLAVVARVAVSQSEYCPWTVYASGAESMLAMNLRAGADVTIPAGKTYLLDMVTPLLGHVKINGRLVFADQDVELHATQVTVFSGGELRIGACTCPFTKKAMIELHGARSSANPDGVGTKGVGVLPGGLLHMFGEYTGPSWTTMAQTADIGATDITLSESVTWQVGDEIVLSSSDYDMDQAEPFKITAISSDAKTLTLNASLEYVHYADTYKTMSMRTQVGHLTRRILVRGASDSFSDSDGDSKPDEFGGHIMCMGAYLQCFISGVEVTQAGQAGFLGRYPLHQHMANDVTDRAFWRDNAVHNNFQRAFVVHHTDNMVVQRNVGYNTFGHMYFLEDGIEQNNKFYWNLGLNVNSRPDGDSKQLLPSDSSPAVLWITNPNNNFVGNVMAGSPRHCIWYALPVNPMTDNSRTDTMCPRRMPLLQFDHNEVHSCGDDGLFVDSGPDADGVPGGTALDFNWPDANGNNVWASVGAPYNPVLQPVDGLDPTLDIDDTPVDSYFNSFTAWKCRNRGAWFRPGKIIVDHPRYADVRIGMTMATNHFTALARYGTFIGRSPNKGLVLGDGHLQDTSGYCCEPDNRGCPSWESCSFSYRGVEHYDGPNLFKDFECYDFTAQTGLKGSCISLLRRDEFSVSSSNAVEGAILESGNLMVYFPDLAHDGDYQSVFKDLDGSVTGRPPRRVANTTHLYSDRAAVVHSIPYLHTPSCIDMSATSSAYYCPDHFAKLSVNFESAVNYPNLNSVSELVRFYREGTQEFYPICGGPCTAGPSADGETDTKTLGTATGFAGLVILGQDHVVEFVTQPPSRVSLTMQYADRHQNGAADASGPFNEIRVGLCYPPGTTVSSIQWGWKTLDLATTEATSLDDLKSATVSTDWSTLGTKMWYMDSNGILWLRAIVTEDRTAENMLSAYPAAPATVQVNLPGSYSYNGGNNPVVCPSIYSGSDSDTGALPGVNAPSLSRSNWGPEVTLPPRDQDIVVGTICTNPNLSPSQPPSGSQDAVIVKTNLILTLSLAELKLLMNDSNPTPNEIGAYLVQQLAAISGEKNERFVMVSVDIVGDVVTAVIRVLPLPAPEKDEQVLANEITAAINGGDPQYAASGMQAASVQQDTGTSSGGSGGGGGGGLASGAIAGIVIGALVGLLVIALIAVVIVVVIIVIIVVAVKLASGGGSAASSGSESLGGGALLYSRNSL